MGRTLQVRDVPDAVHRALKARAARSGVSLSDYLRSALARIADLPPADELRVRLRALPPLTVPKRELPEAIIRRHRGPLP